mgnify:CR=1 FL=1
MKGVKKSVLKKAIFVFILIFCILLTACSSENSDNTEIIGTEEVEQTADEPQATSSTEHDDDPQGEGEDDEADSRTVSQVSDVGEAVLIFVEKLSHLDTYRSVSTGETRAKVLFANYVQTISSGVEKSGDTAYFYSDFRSALLNTTHQAYISENMIAYRDDDFSSPDVTDVSNYNKIYGFVPTEELLCGFVINEETLISAELVGKENGEYTFKIIIDGELAGSYMKTQMKKMGGLYDLPVFSEVICALTVSEDWMPVKTELSSSYTAAFGLLGKVKCNQILTTVYTDVGGQVPIENADFWDGFLK